MRITKNNLFADAPQEIAEKLIAEQGWTTAGRSLGTARFISPQALNSMVDSKVTETLTGGKTVPPNRDWSATVMAGVGGTGLVEWRCINGTVQLRGYLNQSITATGSHSVVRTFPKGTEAYLPSSDLNFTVYAIDTGTAYRVALARIVPTGAISLAAPTGKFNGVEFGGIEYRVF